jgi:hypothetical protein
MDSDAAANMDSALKLHLLSFSCSATNNQLRIILGDPCVHVQETFVNEFVQPVKI